jgi:hypothetical protein
MMESNPIFYQLLLVSLLWLCFVLHVLWPDERAPIGQKPFQPHQPPKKRSKAPKPCVALS